MDLRLYDSMMSASGVFEMSASGVFENGTGLDSLDTFWWQ